MAQVNLGYEYTNGRGVPQDYAQAMEWYRKAADQGDAQAKYNLGSLYSNGQGVPQDSAQAAAWWRKAADQGHAMAQYMLGLSCYNGQGVPQDFVSAHMWLNLAASRQTGTDKKTYEDTRNWIAKQMTPQQVTDAQRRAREWQAAFEKRQKSSAR